MPKSTRARPLARRDTKSPARPGAKRARTRARLLDVAAQMFQRHGIAAVSLDAVARRAGVTKGAIYGNFASKDDLLFAVVAERVARPRPVFGPDAPLDGQLRALVKQAGARTPAAMRQLRFLIELDLYGLTHEAMGDRLRAFAAERYRRSAEGLEAVARREKLSLPPAQLAIAVHALLNGLLYQRAHFPGLVTDATILKALQALVRPA
jgi:AcrR family transcriptional regulator